MSKRTLEMFQTRRLPEAYDYLAPDCSEIRLLPEVEGGGLAHCLLPSGAVSRAVVHQTVEEIWYFISGAGQVWRKQGTTEHITDVGPGTGLSIPVGTQFQFRNSGNDPLCFIVATIPRWPGPQEASPVEGFWQATSTQCE